MKNLPDDVAAYQRTKSFTQNSVPPCLLTNHSTKEDLWGLIQIEKGQLKYTIDNNEVHILTPEICGIVEPNVTHHIRPLGEVLFSVEFYR